MINLFDTNNTPLLVVGVPQVRVHRYRIVKIHTIFGHHHDENTKNLPGIDEHHLAVKRVTKIIFDQTDNRTFAATRVTVKCHKFGNGIVHCYLVYRISHQTPRVLILSMMTTVRVFDFYAVF